MNKQESKEKKAYEKPSMRELPLDGAFTIGAYGYAPDETLTNGSSRRPLNQGNR